MVYIYLQILLCLDDHYIDHADEFLTVLRSLIQAVLRWFPVKPVGGAHIALSAEPLVVGLPVVTHTIHYGKCIQIVVEEKRIMV